MSSKYSLQDSDDELDLSFSEDKENSFTNSHTRKSTETLHPGDFAIAKVYGKTKQSVRLYVIKICYLVDDGYVRLFYKKGGETMKFSVTTEESFIDHADIVRGLSSPTVFFLWSIQRYAFFSG